MGPLTIAHLSDLHCGEPHFVPDLMERAIAEINELEARHRRLLRRPDDLRVQGGVRPGEALPRPDRLRGARRRARQPRLAQRRLRPLRGAVRRAELGPAHGRASTVVAVDSTEPDLDHGQIGRGRYGWIEEQFAAEPADLRIFVLHHHLLPIPGTGRERNVVYDAGDAIECLQRAGVHLVLSGHKHVPYAWKLENLFVVNTGTVSTLRLRGNTRPCYNVIEVEGTHVAVWRRYPFHGQERIIQFDLATGEYEKYTGRIEREVTAKR